MRIHYGRFLGAELRRIRRERGWTRVEAVDRIRVATGVVLSRQTLAAYEHGTRSCSITRLCQICAALDVDVRSVVSAMEARAKHWRESGAPDTAGVVVDLDLLTAASASQLRPVRRWARSMVDSGQFQVVDGRRAWLLTDETFAPLVTLCAVPLGQLLLLLDPYVHPPAARTWASSEHPVIRMPRRPPSRSSRA